MDSATGWRKFGGGGIGPAGPPGPAAGAGTYHLLNGHTNGGPATYTALGTDSLVEIDTSGGGASVKLFATPVLCQEISIVWSGGTTLPTIDGNGKNVSDYAGGNGVNAATTVMSTPGGFITYKYNGTGWKQVG